MLKIVIDWLNNFYFLFFTLATKNLAFPEFIDMY